MKVRALVVVGHRFSAAAGPLVVFSQAADQARPERVKTRGTPHRGPALGRRPRICIAQSTDLFRSFSFLPRPKGEAPLAVPHHPLRREALGANYLKPQLPMKETRIEPHHQGGE